MFEYRAAHIRLVDVDVETFNEGQRGFDYVGVIGGRVRDYNESIQPFAWAEGSAVVRSNVRYSRGLFFQSTEIRNETTSRGFVMFANFRGFHARDTVFRHVVNGPTTYLMLRVYGAFMSFRNNLWFSQVNGGGANGTSLSMLGLGGPVATPWRDDDTAGPLTGTVPYGLIAEKMIAQNNQFYSAGSFITNGVASTGGNPSGTHLVRPRLVGWEDNVWHPAGNVALAVQNANLAGEYAFWRNNKRNMGAGTDVGAIPQPPNGGVGDAVSFHGPYLIEPLNSRPGVAPF
jgi:hypothetical protein